MEDSDHSNGKSCASLTFTLLIEQVEKTIIFDALPSEIVVATNRYAIATVPLNSVSDQWKLVFCESLGVNEGYSAGRGIDPSELQRVISAAVKVSKEFMEAADAEVQRIRKSG